MNVEQEYTYGSILEDDGVRPATMKEWGMLQTETARRFYGEQVIDFSDNTNRFMAQWSRHYARTFRELCGGPKKLPVNVASDFLPEVLHHPLLQENVQNHEFFINEAVNAGVVANTEILTGLSRYLRYQRGWESELLLELGQKSRQSFAAETGGTLAATKKISVETSSGIYALGFLFPHVNARKIDSKPLVYLLNLRKNLVECIAAPEPPTKAISIENARKVA